MNRLTPTKSSKSTLHHFCIISDSFYLQNPPDQLLGEGKEMPSQDMNFADRTRPQPRQKPQPKRLERLDRRDRRDRRDPRDRLPFRFFRRRCRRRRGAIPRRAKEVHEIRLAVDLAWLDPKKKWWYVVMHVGMTEEHDLYSMCIIHTIYYNIMDINTYIT